MRAYLGELEQLATVQCVGRATYHVRLLLPVEQLSLAWVRGKVRVRVSSRVRVRARVRARARGYGLSSGSVSPK